MRVMQVVPTLDIGGAERVATDLSCQLAQAGHAVSVVRLFGPPTDPVSACARSNEAELRVHDVRLHSLGKRAGLDLRVIPRLAATVAADRPDVIHTHTYVLRYVLPALAFGRSRPIVHTIHNLATRDVDWPGILLQFAAFRMGVTTVAIGEAVAASFQQTYRLAPRRVIPNGIRVSQYAASASDGGGLRAQLGIPGDVPTFVTVARLTAQKNHACLLRAFASPRLEAAGAHLLLAGGGELRGELEALARDLGVERRVHFLGERADVPRVLAAADVFVLPSLWEGNPLAVMEAMAAGRPVVATAVGCVPELVRDGCGCTVPPGDVGALEAAMMAEGSDLAVARRRGASALAAALARFDVGTMARAYEALYAEVVP